MADIRNQYNYSVARTIHVAKDVPEYGLKKGDKVSMTTRTPSLNGGASIEFSWVNPFHGKQETRIGLLMPQEWTPNAP